ncbi:uncharacterized protein [Equus asinus]|uniref:protein FAM156A/FAM156B isoform X3 n=1 Tax=Equus asinus TaxID=9793 RepID=UPI0038F6B1F2
MAPTSVHISTPGPAQNNDRTNASVSGEVPPLTEMPPEPTRNHTIHSAPGVWVLLAPHVPCYLLVLREPSSSPSSPDPRASWSFEHRLDLHGSPPEAIANDGHQ